MNFKELENRALDLVLGPKVEGTVAAVLSDVVSPDDIPFSRYVVKDQNNNFVGITVLKARGINFGLLPVICIENPNLSRGQHINVRVASVTPWIDGSR